MLLGSGAAQLAPPPPIVDFRSPAALCRSPVRFESRNADRTLSSVTSGISLGRSLSRLVLHKQAQRHAIPNALILAATSTAQDAVSTKIILKQCELAFGETVRVVGDSDAFGNWSHDNGPELTWHEGHNWETEVELVPGTSTFKLVIVHGDGNPQWEGGDNRSVTVPGDADGGRLTLGCYFDQTGCTDVQVTPAAAAQQDLVPDTKEDVVDEFAAGDAAPQVEAQHQRNGVGADSSVVDDGLIDEFAAGDAAVQIEGAQGQVDKVEQDAEARQQAGNAEEQSQASAVKQEMKQAAPKEDLEDTLSVLQGAESDLQDQQPSQAPQASKQSFSAKPTASQSQAAQQEKPSSSAEDPSKSPGTTQDIEITENSAQSFPTFGKSKVSEVARDGSITFTFEEDDDTDLQSLTSQLLG